MKEESLSVIISTAYMDEAERCAEVYVMYDGKILQQGTPQYLSEQVRGLTWQVKPPEQMKARELQAHLLDNHSYITDAVLKEMKFDLLPVLIILNYPMNSYQRAR